MGIMSSIFGVDLVTRCRSSCKERILLAKLLVIRGQHNKSLDASGGSAFRIMTGPGWLNEFAPPRQLRRWPSSLSHEKRYLLNRILSSVGAQCVNSFGLFLFRSQPTEEISRG
jgi:hypothetical protein